MSTREKVAAKLFGTRIGTDYISLYDAEALADAAIGAYLNALKADGYSVVRIEDIRVSALDSRIIEMIVLMHAGRDDDAIALLKAFSDELPRPVWCPHDHRQTLTDATQHQAERGIPA